VAEDDATTRATVETWLPVIGNALAYLCLDKHETKYPEKMNSILKKVKFLEGLGVPAKNAAGSVGSTAGSIRVLKHHSRKVGGKKNGGRRGRKK
jgi:hypothetical protein